MNPNTLNNQYHREYITCAGWPVAVTTVLFGYGETCTVTNVLDGNGDSIFAATEATKRLAVERAVEYILSLDICLN